MLSAFANLPASYRRAQWCLPGSTKCPSIVTGRQLQLQLCGRALATCIFRSVGLPPGAYMYDADLRGQSRNNGRLLRPRSRSTTGKKIHVRNCSVHTAVCVHNELCAHSFAPATCSSRLSYFPHIPASSFRSVHHHHVNANAGGSSTCSHRRGAPWTPSQYIGFIPSFCLRVKSAAAARPLMKRSLRPFDLQWAMWEGAVSCKRSSDR